MADFNQYDPSKVSASWNGIRIVGYAEGTMISPTRDEDAYTGSAGTQGDVVVVRNLNKMGIVTFTLQQSSPTNSDLSIALEDSERTGVLQIGELLISDLNGTTLIKAENAWVMKSADPEYGDELSSREWRIQCAELELAIRGHENAI